METPEIEGHIRNTLLDFYKTVRTDRYGQVPKNTMVLSIFKDRKKEVEEYCIKTGILEFSTYGGRYGIYTSFNIEDTILRKDCYEALRNNPHYIRNINSF